MSAEFQKILLDADSGVYLQNWRTSAEDFPGRKHGGPKWCIHKGVLVGGRQHGVDLLRVDNGCFAFDIIPTRGMGIQEATFDGIRLGWDSPISEVVHPAYVDYEEMGGLGWLRGFSEWFVRCGMTSVGAPCQDRVKDNQGRIMEATRTLHGRVANTPASYVAVRVATEPPYEIRVHGTVLESRMFGENLRLDTVISTIPGSNQVRIQDRVTNCRAVPDQMQMLYHINYGSPMLEPGSRLLMAADLVMPREPYPRAEVRAYDRYGEPQAGKVEQCFFMLPRADRRGVCCHGLRNSAGDLAISHTYLRKQLPCFTQWKNEAAQQDGYVTGLEPGTSYPNPISFERKQGRIKRLGPGKSWSSEITLAVHVGRKAVTALQRRIKAVQGRASPRVLPAPSAAYGEST